MGGFHKKPENRGVLQLHTTIHDSQPGLISRYLTLLYINRGEKVSPVDADGTSRFLSIYVLP